jgi:hypothetical protein
MSMTDQQKHDFLLEVRPDGASHDNAVCMYCTSKASEEENVADDPVAIFTQEQHDVLLATAVEKAVVEASTSADAEVLSLNEQLEAASTAADESARTIAELETAAADRVEAERLAVLAGERVEAVAAVVEFSDEQIETRKEAWTSMSEEDFDAYLDDLRAVAKAAPAAEEIPKSSFDGTRATAGEEGTEVFVINDFFTSDLEVAAQS